MQAPEFGIRIVYMTASFECGLDLANGLIPPTVHSTTACVTLLSIAIYNTIKLTLTFSLADVVDDINGNTEIISYLKTKQTYTN